MNIFVADIGQGKAHFYDSDADKFYGKMNDVDLIVNHFCLWNI